MPIGGFYAYQKLQSPFQSVPFASSPASGDIESYVVSKALEGLFLVLGEQERKIRTKPAAQVTGPPDGVFGK